ncbi:GNAT family N-acetyltransferase [Candidatus Gottesmanbacteria bacterium]|nr:GNAT family N-acetyltransferase [Candidatus Gottesmanbacteria bacterium]
MVEQFAKGADIRLEDALLIQAEAEAGCQTMFIKDKDGIKVFHSEEDVDDQVVTALNRRRDPNAQIPTDENEWKKFSNDTPYNYRNVHIKTQDGHERTFFAYAGIATGGPAFGINQETGTLVASDVLFTDSDVSVAKGIWPNAICALYQDVGDISKARLLTNQIHNAIQNGQLEGITGGYAVHMAQAGKIPSMATFEFGHKTITEMAPKEVVHINEKTGEREIRYVTARPNLPKNPELTAVDALNSEALLVKLNRRFPAVEKHLRSLLEKTSLSSCTKEHRELAEKLSKNKSIPIFDVEVQQAIESGFPNLVEEAKHASKAFWGHLKMATWQVEMDRRLRRMEKYGAFIEFPGRAEGKDAMLDALRRIATTRHGDIDPTTNTWRQVPEKDNAGLINPWNVAVMTAYIDTNGVHGEIHKLTPPQTVNKPEKQFVLVGTGAARGTLQDFAARRIGTGRFSEDTTVLRESTVETYPIDKEGWEKIKNKIITLENTQGGDYAFTAEELQKHFTDPDNTVALLKHKGKIIGYSYAMPTTKAYNENDPVFEGRMNDDKTAYIYNVVIDKNFQGRGLVGKLNSTLEGKLRAQQYTHIEIDAAIKNGYANAIQKAYGSRILLSHDHSSIHGNQRYFLIDIKQEASPNTMTFVVPKTEAKNDDTHTFVFTNANKYHKWTELPSLHTGANIQLGECIYRITYMRDSIMTAWRVNPKTNSKIDKTQIDLSYIRDEATDSVTVTMPYAREAARALLEQQIRIARRQQSELANKFSKN